MSELIVVGIGASAGGVQPMIEVLSEAVCNKSMSYVVVPHISRFIESNLDSILGRVAGLESAVIEDGMKVEACKLYTIPPNKYVRFAQGRLHLSDRPEKSPNNSADVFFESIAHQLGKNAIGVVLSGAAVGSDGTAGVVAIKRAGGTTFAQDPVTAEFKDMPSHAIETGCVDRVLTPHEIGIQLSQTLFSKN